MLWSYRIYFTWWRKVYHFLRDKNSFKSLNSKINLSYGTYFMNSALQSIFHFHFRRYCVQGVSAHVPALTYWTTVKSIFSKRAKENFLVIWYITWLSLIHVATWGIIYLWPVYLNSYFSNPTHWKSVIMSIVSTQFIDVK